MCLLRDGLSNAYANKIGPRCLGVLFADSFRVWFDRNSKFKPIATRVAIAERVIHHLHSLANTVHDPTASSLCKTFTVYVLPLLLYGGEAWSGGRSVNPCNAQSLTVSAKIVRHGLSTQSTSPQLSKRCMSLKAQCYQHSG
jgi:hypothetical protein